jgi:Na+-driven multidrug efflux pump
MSILSVSLIILTLLIGTTESFTTPLTLTLTLTSTLTTNHVKALPLTTNRRGKFSRSSSSSLNGHVNVNRYSNSHTSLLLSSSSRRTPLVLFDSVDSGGVGSGSGVRINAEDIDFERTDAATPTTPTKEDAISTKEEGEKEKDVILSTSLVSTSIGNNNNSTTNGSTATTAVDNSSPNSLGVNVPSYRTLLVFSSTTILIWLSEPLLSLVDTAVVGMTGAAGGSVSAVVQLASLGPATTLIDSLLYLTYFLAIATTNLAAPALSEKEYRPLQTYVSHVLSVAIVLGIAVTLTVFIAGTSLLTSMAGSSASAELITCAVQYSQIRACVAVSSVVGMVAQALLLTVQDMRTPAIAVAVASIVNVVGDISLRRYGVQGAAVATAAACVASTTILMRKVRKQMVEWRQLEVVGNINSSNGNSYANTTATAIGSAQQLDNTELLSPADTGTDKVPLLRLPDRKSLLQLVLLSGPIFLVMVAKIACYGAMTLRCTDFGVTALASHNIMMRIFFFYGCFGDSISQTAQTFLPVTLYPARRPKEFRQILGRLLCMTAVVGVFNSQTSVWMLRNLSGYLTQDAGIINMMRDHTGFFGLAILLHPFIMVCEGAVIASRDFTNLLKTYAVTLSLHFGILKYYSGSFPAVWRTFFLFQLIRLANFGFRVIREQRRSIRAQQGEQDSNAAAAAAAIEL